MLRLVQCLCPKRHAILGAVYDTAHTSSADALSGLQANVESLVAKKIIRRFCEICNAPVSFHYEDGKLKEQDHAKAIANVLDNEAQQMATQKLVKDARRHQNS